MILLHYLEFAGMLATSSKYKGNVIPGVAIATVYNSRTAKNLLT